MCDEVSGGSKQGFVCLERDILKRVRASRRDSTEKDDVGKRRSPRTQIPDGGTEGDKITCPFTEGLFPPLRCMWTRQGLPKRVGTMDIFRLMHFCGIGFWENTQHMFTSTYILNPASSPLLISTS